MQAVTFSLFILIGNPLVVWVIMGWLGYTKRTTFMVGLAVAQVSEFSLLLLLLVTKTQGVPIAALSLMTMVGVLTIVGSTLLIQQADRIFKILQPLMNLFERTKTLSEKQGLERYDVFLFGCHRVGTDFIRTVRKRKLSYLVIDFDPQVIASLEAKKIPSRYGDAYDNELMEELDLAHAKMLICTVPDHETNLFLLEKGKKANKFLTIITTAHSVSEAQRLYKAGASYVIMPHYLGGNQAALLVEKHGHKQTDFTIERRRHLQHLSGRGE